MNSRKPSPQTGAFTLMEMLVVIGIIAILAALLLPALTGAKARAKRIACTSQLRELGLAFHSFAHDHNSKFPMAVPAAEGGSLEFAESSYLAEGNFYFGYRHFQTLAGFLQTPAILLCPADTRTAATNFAGLLNTNVSYFVNLTADYSRPMSILAGDGNLTGQGTLIRLASGAALAWTAEQHKFKGNLLFADGHVEEAGRGGRITLDAGGDFVRPTPGSTSQADNFFPSAGKPGQNHPASKPNPPATTVGSNHSPDPAPAPAAPAEAAPKSSSTRTTSRTISVVSTGAPPLEANTHSTMPAVAKTNPPVQIFSTPTDDDAGISLFDRRIAKILRHVIGWSYLLLLLLFITLLIWKIRRWLKEREQRRKLDC